MEEPADVLACCQPIVELHRGGPKPEGQGKNAPKTGKMIALCKMTFL